MKFEGKACHVVLLNWNGWRDTLECLATLLPTLSPSASVMVCDNGSTDDSISQIAAWVRQQFPNFGPFFLTPAEVSQGTVPAPGQVYILANGANLGFAAGNNTGVGFALNDPQCAYVWLLNNDTRVDADSLAAAVEHMERDSSIGICGSTLVYWHEVDMVQAFGGAVYSDWTGRSRHLGAFAKRADVPLDPAEIEAQMSYVVGAAMLVSRRFIEQVGLMREDYFLYGEENDWARRGRGQFRLGYAPASLVWHKEGASIGTSASGGSPLSLFYLFRNRLRFAWRFTPMCVPSVLFFCGLDLAKLLVKRRWLQAWAALRGILQLRAPNVAQRS